MSPRQAALITGSSRGIGLATAEALARAGFDIALNGPADDAELAAAVEAVAPHGGKVVEVRRRRQRTGHARSHAGQGRSRDRPAATLVNNAGVSVLSRGDLLDVTEESYDRCMAINARRCSS